MSDHHAIVAHTVMLLIMACLLLMIVRNHRADIQALHDRLDTQFMNGHIVAPPPPAPESTREEA